MSATSLLLFGVLALSSTLMSVVNLSEGCTAIGITSKATKQRTVFLAHTDDAGGEASDIRLVPIPPLPITTKRPVFHFVSGYPRLVTDTRGEHYKPIQQQMQTQQVQHELSQVKIKANLLSNRGGKGKQQEDEQELFTPLGYAEITALTREEFGVDEVDQPKLEGHSYRYFDQDYGLANEHQLSVAESTCGAKTVGWSSDVPYGYNLFGIAELSKVAMERCITAKCAVLLMGQLAEKYGFYSEDSGDPNAPGYDDSAEALIIADKFDNVWVFNILTGKNNASSIWAAQRVPDGHITAVANGLSIRAIDFEDTNNYLWSENIVGVARELGFYKGKDGDAFDFTAVFGYDDGTPILPLYVGRRIWRIYDFFAPSLKLNSTIGVSNKVETYPFSIKPDKGIDITEVMHILKDHYEGTIFDMTKGIEAGPFGNPNRFPVPKKTSRIVGGGWERPISIFRSLFSFVVQIEVDMDRNDVFNENYAKQTKFGVLWYGQDKPHGTVYLPFACDQESLPHSYLIGMQSKFDHKSAWRAFSFVNNWAMLRYDSISAEIKSHQDGLQAQAFELVDSLQPRHVPAIMGSSDLNMDDMQSCRMKREKKLNEFAQSVVEYWWSLAWELVAKYSDGYETIGEKPGEQRPLGYPDWWLNMTSFPRWPGNTYTPPVTATEEKHQKLRWNKYFPTIQV